MSEDITQVKDNEKASSGERTRDELAVSWLRAATHYIDAKHKEVSRNTTEWCTGEEGDEPLIDDHATWETQQAMSQDDWDAELGFESYNDDYEGMIRCIEEPDDDYNRRPKEHIVDDYARAEKLRQFFIKEHNIDPIAAQITLLPDSRGSLA